MCESLKLKRFLSKCTRSKIKGDEAAVDGFLCLQTLFDHLQRGSSDFLAMTEASKRQNTSRKSRIFIDLVPSTDASGMNMQLGFPMNWNLPFYR